MPKYCFNYESGEYEWIEKELGISIKKEDQQSMNKVSIGVCATKEVLKNEK